MIIGDDQLHAAQATIGKKLGRSLEFAAMVVAPPDGGPPPPEITGPEIVVGAVTVRLEPGASAERVASIVRALAAGS